MDNPYTRFGCVETSVAVGDSGLDFLLKLLDGTYPGPPFAEVCDVWPVEAAKGRVVFLARPSIRFYNPMGIVHGGWTSTVLDTAMGCAIHSMLRARQSYTTVEMKVNFIRPLLEQTGVIRCEGNIVHLGGQLATSEGRLTDSDGNLIAHGMETCLISRHSQDPPH